MRRRIFLVGTDTEVGKTTLACALVRAGEAAGLRVLPFKPAASGPAGPDGDPERLAAACSLGLRPAQICPLRYAEPVAPGVAWDPAAFLADPKDRAVSTGPIEQVAGILADLEALVRPTLTLIEGAGGLHVPMPGGTWLPAWISRLEARTVVVGRLGLGTINHTLLTIAALRGLGLAPCGFFMVDAQGGADPSRAHNPGIVAAESGVPCLGVMPFAARDAGWLAPPWARLIAE